MIPWRSGASAFCQNGSGFVLRSLPEDIHAPIANPAGQQIGHPIHRGGITKAGGFPAPSAFMWLMQDPLRVFFRDQAVGRYSLRIDTQRNFMSRL